MKREQTTKDTKSTKNGQGAALGGMACGSKVPELQGICRSIVVCLSPPSFVIFVLFVDDSAITVPLAFSLPCPCFFERRSRCSGT